MIDGVIRIAQFGLPRIDFPEAKMRPEHIYEKRHDITEKSKQEQKWFAQFRFDFMWINLWMNAFKENIFLDENKQMESWKIKSVFLTHSRFERYSFSVFFFLRNSFHRFRSNSAVAISVGTLEWFEQCRYVCEISMALFFPFHFSNFIDSPNFFVCYFPISPKQIAHMPL